LRSPIDGLGFFKAAAVPYFYFLSALGVVPAAVAALTLINSYVN